MSFHHLPVAPSAKHPARAGCFLFFLLLLLQSAPAQIPSDDDSLAVEIGVLQEETDTLDTVEDDPDESSDLPPWTLDLGLKYRSRHFRNGVDLSGGHSTLEGTLDLSHEHGFMAGLGYDRATTGTYRAWNFIAGYTWAVADWLDIGLAYSRSSYQGESPSIVSLAVNDLALSFSFTIHRTVLDLSYDYYFGQDAFNYLSLTYLGLYRIGDLRVTPLVSLALTAFQIDTKKLTRSGKKFIVTTGKSKEAGIAQILASLSLTYPVSTAFSVNLTPALIRIPESLLSDPSSDFLIKAGISYELGF